MPTSNSIIYYIGFQNGQANVVIDNLHSIIAAAAVKFSDVQLAHLFSLIQQVCDLHALLSYHRITWDYLLIENYINSIYEI